MKKVAYYESFDFNYPELKFKFNYKNKIYQFKIFFRDIEKTKFEFLESSLLDYLFFHIGISLLPYLFCLDDLDEIVIKPYCLNEYSRNFISDFLVKGMAEFKYQNKLDLRKKIVISNFEESPVYEEADSEGKMQERVLLLCGGGKDSVVAGKMIQDLGIDFSWLIINPNKHRMELAEKINQKIITTSFLTVDEQFKKDRKFDGHKPLNVYLGFVGVLISKLFDYKYICVGNEKSSNDPNLIVDSFSVNHQYSKSYEFEEKFFKYVKKEISSEVYYFSPLRGLCDLQLGKIFANFKDFYQTIISCNDNQKESSWCCVCAKCTFTFLIFYPFMSDGEIFEIFGKNLFDDKKNRDWIQEMCQGEVKPFECIGTKDECRLALYLCLIKEGGNLKEKEYYQELKDLVGDLDIKKASEEYLFNFQGKNNIPENFKSKIDNFCEKYIEKK
jgi:hypothetical protein